jgi:hypothetical protein
VSSPPPSPEDGNRSSFQNVVFSRISDDGKGPKTQYFHGVRYYDYLKVSCYTATAHLAVIRVWVSNFVQVANVRTCKRETKRGPTPKQTYMEAAKEVLVKASNLRKSSAK